MVKECCPPPPSKHKCVSCCERIAQDGEQVKSLLTCHSPVPKLQQELKWHKSRNDRGFFRFCFFQSEVLKAGSHSVAMSLPLNINKRQELRMAAILECQINTEWQAQIFGFLLKLGFQQPLFVASKRQWSQCFWARCWDTEQSPLLCHPYPVRSTGASVPFGFEQAIFPSWATAAEGFVYWN